VQGRCDEEVSVKKVVLAIVTVAVFSAGSVSALCVKAPEANLRSGPGTRYEKLWEVFQYMPLKRVGKKGSWYKVSDVDGDKYWVYAPLVTTKYKCAVVRKDKANVRSGPGTEYRQLPMSPALKYYSFKVLKTQGKWVKVVDEYGDEGWVYRPLVWIQ
jgi:SH3-like domain-containing protein